jgi:2-haloacid dehalogenase
MNVGRRQVLGGFVASAMLGAGSNVRAAAAMKIRGVAFDAFPIFDPRAVTALAEEVFPGRGAALAEAWRTRQFDYAWLSRLAGKYQDFLALTDAALVTTAADLKLELSPEQRRRLTEAYLSLKPWPDAPPVLARLKSAGLKVALLSNLTAAMLEGSVASSGLEGVFDYVISTDAVKSYKPDPRAYQRGIDALTLPKSAIAFVAFAGWDAFGAKSFGYPTFWNNRTGQAAESLGAPADAESPDLRPLLDFVGLA